VCSKEGNTQQKCSSYKLLKKNKANLMMLTQETFSIVNSRKKEKTLISRRSWSKSYELNAGNACYCMNQLQSSHLILLKSAISEARQHQKWRNRQRVLLILLVKRKCKVWATENRSSRLRSVFEDRRKVSDE